MHGKTAIFYKSKFTGQPSSVDFASDPLSPLINPDELTSQQRLDLREKINAGKLAGVRFWAVVFGDEPNLQNARPRPGQLSAIAKDAVGRSVVYDHDSTMAAKKGKLLASKVEANAAKIDQLYLLNEIVDQEAMLDVVNGKVDEFSVGLFSDNWVCSKCDTPAWFGFFGPYMDCECEDAELFAEAPVHFLHNSIVTQGAYRETGFAANFSASNLSGDLLYGIKPLNPGAQPKAAKTTKLSADPAPPPPAQAAPTSDADKRILALEMRIFESEWSVALDAGAVLPVDRPRYLKVKKEMGVEMAIELIKGLRPGSTVPMERHSHSDPPPTEAQTATQARFELSELSVKMGFFPQSVLDAVKKQHAEKSSLIRHPLLTN